MTEYLVIYEVGEDGGWAHHRQIYRAAWRLARHGPKSKS
jgi:hypothetical protein